MPPFYVTRQRPELTTAPDRLYLAVPGLPFIEARSLAAEALDTARRTAPKLSGRSAARFQALYGDGFIGIWWTDPYVWMQEAGIRPFTMRRLEGRTVPLWLDDPTGRLRQQHPRAQTRRTASGRTQVLIFRKVARMGQRKQVRQPDGSMRSVPASYPGAPGRIVLREAVRPYTTIGKVGGRIAARNVGVRWRHPGLSPRSFLYYALANTADNAGWPHEGVYVANAMWAGARVLRAA